MEKKLFVTKALQIVYALNVRIHPQPSLQQTRQLIITECKTAKHKRLLRRTHTYTQKSSQLENEIKAQNAQTLELVHSFILPPLKLN